MRSGPVLRRRLARLEQAAARGRGERPLAVYGESAWAAMPEGEREQVCRFLPPGSRILLLADELPAAD